MSAAFAAMDNDANTASGATIHSNSATNGTSTNNSNSTTANTGHNALRLLWDTLALATRPCDAVTDAGAWSCALVGQCLSRARRVQFDEEHQRSLLSCHSTEDGDGSVGGGGRGGHEGGGGGGGGYSFSDDAALELRRRVMKDEAAQRYLPTFARDLGPQYPVHQVCGMSAPRGSREREMPSCDGC